MAGCAGNARTPAPLLAQPPMVSTSTIEIALNGVKQSDGDGPIHIALWGSERTFMKDGEWVRGVSVAAADASKITAGSVNWSKFTTCSAGEPRQPVGGLRPV